MIKPRLSLRSLSFVRFELQQGIKRIYPQRERKFKFNMSYVVISIMYFFILQNL